MTFLAVGHPHSLFPTPWTPTRRMRDLPGMRECVAALHGTSAYMHAGPELMRILESSRRLPQNSTLLLGQRQNLQMFPDQGRRCGISARTLPLHARRPSLRTRALTGPTFPEQRACQAGLQGSKGMRCAVGRVASYACMRLHVRKRFGFEMNNSPFQRHRFSTWTRNSPLHPLPSSGAGSGP